VLSDGVVNNISIVEEVECTSTVPFHYQKNAFIVKLHEPGMKWNFSSCMMPLFAKISRFL
jgi:hypothetical protein